MLPSLIALIAGCSEYGLEEIEEGPLEERLPPPDISLGHIIASCQKLDITVCPYNKNQEDIDNDCYVKTISNKFWIEAMGQYIDEENTSGGKGATVYARYLHGVPTTHYDYVIHEGSAEHAILSISLGDNRFAIEQWYDQNFSDHRPMDFFPVSHLHCRTRNVQYEQNFSNVEVSNAFQFEETPDPAAVIYTNAIDISSGQWINILPYRYRNDEDFFIDAAVATIKSESNNLLELNADLVDLDTSSTQQGYSALIYFSPE